MDSWEYSSVDVLGNTLGQPYADNTRSVRKQGCNSYTRHGNFLVETRFFGANNKTRAQREELTCPADSHLNDR